MNPQGTELRRRSPLLYVADGDGPFRGRLAAELRAGGAVVLEFESSERLGVCAAATEPDLILLATDSADAAAGPVYGRLRSSHTGRRFPLVLVLDKSRPPRTVAQSVLALCSDWTRLCVRNLAAVVTWLQTRGKSGRFEVEAFGARGTIFLQDGELVEARWKELQGREVVRFFAEELPDSGFRFAEVAGPPSAEERALELPAPPAALPLPAERNGSTPAFGPVRTALVRLQLGSGGSLRRVETAPAQPATVVVETPHSNGAPAGAHTNGARLFPARGARVSAAHPDVGETAALRSAAGAAPNGDGLAAPESRRPAPAPRRPAFLVRAIWRAERERLLTGTGPVV